MKHLVLGGAGYIGSHFVNLAQESGDECAVVDDLSTGNILHVHPKAVFFRGSILNVAFLKSVLTSFSPDVVHLFAAKAIVSESEAFSDLYLSTNLGGVAGLISAMEETGHVVPLLFASSCSVYGNSRSSSMDEKTNLNPVSIYGKSKLMAEWVLEKWCAKVQGKVIVFRYFNVAGAHPMALIGEAHNPETHLIPRLIFSAMNGSTFTVSGLDKPTPDGSCIRDFISVCDIAAAHMSAASKVQLQKRSSYNVYNLATGRGYSVLQVKSIVEFLTGKKIAFIPALGNSSDPAIAVADVTLIRDQLGFTASHSDLKDIIQSAWNWHNLSSIKIAI